jgi:hypothetical protein
MFGYKDNESDGQWKRGGFLVVKVFGIVVVKQ